jgi:lipoyl(octanoyl) transferase 2
MRLRHVSIPGLSSYTTIGDLQSRLVTRFQAQRANAAHSNPLPPTILTCQFHPTYTAGLRTKLSPADISRLEALGAHVAYTSRGGQLTFHGPGQLVAYPVLDIRAHGLTTACYVRALEDAGIAVCARYGVQARTTENVGVWVRRRGDDGQEEERKIMAVGVRLRRYVASHGVGLNVGTDLRWFEQIVACGLEDKRATSLDAEGVKGLSVDEVGKVFVQEMAKQLNGVEGVDEFAVEELKAELDIMR